MNFLLRISAALLVLTPFVSAQHTVNLAGGWVLNSTLSTVPQDNTNSMVVFGGQAWCNAKADNTACSILGLAQTPIGAFATANTAASGSRQSSYSKPGMVGGIITSSGSAAAAGTATASGGASGTFLCRAAYSNSLGVNISVRARYNGGLVHLTTPKTFAVGGLGNTYSFTSSSRCNVQVQTGFAGSSIVVRATAGAQSVTNLQ